MEITKDFKNSLLKRREIEAVLESEANPGYENSKKEVAEKLKAHEDLVVIKAVRGKFGIKEFNIEAFVYDSKEAREKTEPKAKVKKGEAAAK